MRLSIRHAGFWSLACALVGLASVPARAEDDDQVATDAAQPVAQDGRLAYPSAFFSRFEPRNAGDMLRQVPGFSIKEADEARGLGQATSNVLINGARMTGKNEDALTQLSRIPASNVLRIEIVDAATLQLSGISGQVANIVTASTGIKGQFEYRAEARPHFADPLLARGQVSISGKQGPVDYTLAVSNLANRGGAGGLSVMTRGAGSLIENRDDVLKTHWDEPKITAGFKIDGPGTSVGNLNLALSRGYFRLYQDEVLSIPAQPDRQRTLREREDPWNYEVGVDYEFGLGHGRLKLIGLRRFTHSDYQATVVTAFAPPLPREGDRYAQVSNSGETIGRAEYSVKALGADWQLSGEAAFNSYNREARLFELAPSGDFTETPFPFGTGGVSEDRYESILSMSRPLAPGLSLQVAGGAEYSQLTQIGANARVRSFWRPKGSVSLAWVPTKGLDISFRLARKVGQLEFGDFLARVFLDNNNSNAGNAELVPEQSWEAMVEIKKSLGRWGTSTLSLFDHRIEDFVDFVPIGTDGESPGNLDGGRKYGLEWTSTFQLEPLGLKGAKIDTHLWLRRTQVIDPLTFEVRPMSGRQVREIKLEFRYDIPGSNWAFGGHIDNSAYAHYYRPTEVGLEWEGPTFSGVYVEHKNLLGMTGQLRFGNLLNARNRFDRVAYEGFRDRTPVDFIEHRDRLIGPIFAAVLKGNF